MVISSTSQRSRTEHKTTRKVKDTMFFSKQILLGCLVLLAISAFSEARRTRLVTKNKYYVYLTVLKQVAQPNVDFPSKKKRKIKNNIRNKERVNQRHNERKEARKDDTKNNIIKQDKHTT